MLRRRSALSEGARSVAVAGDVTNSVVVIGDHASARVRVDGPDALLAPLRGQPPRARPRPAPLDVRPAPSPLHVDREDEAAVLAGDAGPVLELHGEQEVGKTFLLAHALAQPAARAMPDGVVYQFVRGAGLEDILQALFEQFYDCQPPYKPTGARIRRDVEEKRALVVLDGVDLGREALQQLVLAAPGCRFVLASRGRALGEGRGLELKGLAAEDALAVVEQELGRSLMGAERAPARELCRALRGHPLKVRQGAAAARDGDTSLQALARELQGAAPDAALGQRMLDALFDHERDLIAQLAALRDAALSADLAAALAGRPDVHRSLEMLEQRRVIASEGPRYRLAGAVAELFPQRDEDAAARAVDHFVSEAGDAGERLGWALGEARAVRELLEWAGQTGRLHETVWLGRAIGPSFAWGRRWDAWESVVTTVLRAASELADSRSEAWALHQLGTRAWSLGEVDAGIEMLQRALKTRQDLDEQVGAAASRHNLEVIDELGGNGAQRAAPQEPLVTPAGAGGGAPAPRVEAPPGRAGPDPDLVRTDGGAGPWKLVVAGMAACVATIVLAVIALANRGDEPDRPEPAPVRESEPESGSRRPDRRAPTIYISVPRRRVYRSGARVRARFMCEDNRAAGLRCDAIVYGGRPAGRRADPPSTAEELRNGGLIDTGLGAHTVRATATDGAGNRRVRERMYEVELRPDRR